jgi:hypothetical protein
MIVVLSVRNAVAVRVSAVGADVVTDAITITIDKVHATAAASASTASMSAVATIVADTIVISVHESRAVADIVAYPITVGIYIFGAASAATLTVLGSSDSYGERDQRNDQDSSHCSYLHFVFTLFEFSPFGQYSISGFDIYNYSRIISKSRQNHAQIPPKMGCRSAINSSMSRNK